MTGPQFGVPVGQERAREKVGLVLDCVVVAVDVDVVKVVEVVEVVVEGGDGVIYAVGYGDGGGDQLSVLPVELNLTLVEAVVGDQQVALVEDDLYALRGFKQQQRRYCYYYQYLELTFPR